MKYLAILALLFAGLTAKAAELSSVTAITAGTPKTVLSGGNYLVKAITWVNNNTTNNAKFWFYDTASDVTNRERAAYTSYTTYTTNYSTVFTNTLGLLVTNTFAGVYTGSSTVAATTNQAPIVLGTYLAGPSSTAVIPTFYPPINGLTVFSELAGTLSVTYETR